MLGVVDRVFVAVWLATPSVDAIKRAGAAMHAHAEQHPRGIVSLNVLERSASPPEAPARQAFAGVIRTLGDGVKAYAAVRESEGFGLAIVRSVLTGVTMLVRTPAPLKLFGAVDEAADWLVPHLGPPTLNGVDLTAAVRELRSPARTSDAPSSRVRE
ncbi:MAG: hypothetical protein U0271_07420 [Polyangiaceae bacterium]